MQAAAPHPITPDTPHLRATTENIVDGRDVYRLSVGAVQIDDAVPRAVLATLAPAGLEAALAAAERLEADRDDALAPCRLAAGELPGSAAVRAAPRQVLRAETSDRCRHRATTWCRPTIMWALTLVG